jgi:two-component system, LytTR family, sensor histidine kinase AlgZ
MYPLLARRSHLAAYLLLWLLVGVLLSALLTTQGRLPWTLALFAGVPAAIAYSFICLSAWYVARAMPLARTGSARVIISALAAAALSSAMWLVIGRAWMTLVVARWATQTGITFAALQSMLFGIGVLLYLLSLAVSYVLVVYEASQDAQRRGLQGQVLAREAELRSLRAQIDPHFLFNSLNSISALTTVDPPGARRMCVLLGEFLRETLALGGEDRITVSRELALLERFLAIERIRFGDRLRSELLVGDAGSCFVPPLLLQPLVENAVTHGIAHLIEGGTIRVSAEQNGAWLHIIVENPCDPDRPRRGGAGVGLANVRARLRAMHGADAGLTAGEAHEVWRVELTLPAAIGEAS